MLVTIRTKSPYTYGHHRTSRGTHTCMGMFFVNICVSLNIGPHTGMARV